MAVGKASVMKQLNALLREVENLPWERRSLCSTAVVERVLEFSEEFRRAQESMSKLDMFEELKRRVGKPPRKAAR